MTDAPRWALAGLMAPPEHSFANYCKEGLAVSARNLFYWYVYPSTADSIDEVVLIFEDIDIPIAFVSLLRVEKYPWLFMNPNESLLFRVTIHNVHCYSTVCSDYHVPAMSYVFLPRLSLEFLGSSLGLRDACYVRRLTVFRLDGYNVRVL